MAGVDKTHAAGLLGRGVLVMRQLWVYKSTPLMIACTSTGLRD